jgi:predicted transcriptional regulator
MLLRLAQTYKMDMSALTGSGASDDMARLQSALKDPLFADIELPSLEASDFSTNFPGVTEAFLRLHTAYQEEQLALADHGAEVALTAGRSSEALDPVAESRRFLGARRNSFPLLDDAAERLAQIVGRHDSIIGCLKDRHGLRVRRVPPKVMVGSTRRLDWHHKEILLDDEMDNASQSFQLALQLAYLEMGEEIDAVLGDGAFATESGERLTRRALAGYAAAAVIMPYSAFARAAEARRYDVEALARQFGASFEQTAHRLTTLQKPGQERVPFFFIRVDEAGNVSKRLDGAGFPFARHGGGCPLWNVHQAFRTPRRIVTQWLELPDGQRFFSIAPRGAGHRAGLRGRARRPAHLHTGPARLRTGGVDSGRRHLPPLPPHRVHGPIGAAHRPPDPARRHPPHQRPLRVLGQLTWVGTTSLWTSSVAMHRAALKSVKARCAAIASQSAVHEPAF